MLSELAPNQTPYRYGFNNPVFWSDPSGLFETEKQAETFALDNGIKNYKISFNAEVGGYILTIIGGEFDGQQFYDFGNYELLPEIEIQSGGSDSGSGIKFLGFSPSEIGVLANGAGVYAGTLETYAKNTARMERIAKISGRFSTGLSIYSTASSGYKVYNQYQTGGVENIDGWDLADTTVGVVGLGGSVLVTLGIVSNPVGWVIGAGVLIYGGVRFIQDMNGYH